MYHLTPHIHPQLCRENTDFFTLAKRWVSCIVGAAEPNGYGITPATPLIVILALIRPTAENGYRPFRFTDRYDETVCSLLREAGLSEYA